jgi:signal transduction histidine kinase
MDTLNRGWRIALVGLLVIIITTLHYSTLHHDLASHIAHRELYFIPILLSSLWFGIGYGVVTSLGISLIYTPQLFGYTDSHTIFWPLMFQIIMFNSVALMVGYLAERWKRQQERMLAVERAATIGDAAKAVGYEMKDLLDSLKFIAARNKLKFKDLGQEYEKEMQHLEQMVDILSSFKSADSIQRFAYDLNPIIRDRIDYHRPIATIAGATFKVDLDEIGCPSQVNAESITRIIDRIIQNAIDASPRGGKISVISKRGGDYNLITISDEGPGIKPENLSKIFKPFFTTKIGGSGLSLSASHKVLREMGGDIQASSQYGQGAMFSLYVPREFPAHPRSINKE